MALKRIKMPLKCVNFGNFGPKKGGEVLKIVKCFSRKLHPIG